MLAIGLSHKLKRRDLFWAALTGCTIAMYTVIDAQGVRARAAGTYIVWTFLMLGTGIATLFAVWRGKKFMLAAAEQWKPGLIAGSLSDNNLWAGLVAFRWGATPPASAARLRETSILFATAIAIIFLKERLTRLRWPASPSSLSAR